MSNKPKIPRKTGLPPKLPIEPSMNTDAFYVFIGAIEATVHFISPMGPKGGASGDSKRTTASSPHQKGPRTVADELRALLSIKEDLLRAEADLNYILHSIPPPDTATIEAAWQAFDKAYNGVGVPFFQAVATLQANAPEWSAMDKRLAHLMDFFKRIAPGSGGTPNPATSWGGMLSSGASSNSGTSLSSVPPNP